MMAPHFLPSSVSPQGGFSLACANGEGGEGEGGSSFQVPPAGTAAPFAEQNLPLNPSLTRILALLEDDDAISEMEATLSPSLRAAYDKNAREIASILQEDSPGLNLNFNMQPRRSIPSLHQLVHSGTGLPRRQAQQMVSGSARNQPMESLPFAVPAFGPPRILARPPYSVPSELLHEGFFTNISAAKTGVIGSSNLNPKGNREHKIANALKRRKEANEVTGVPKRDNLDLTLIQLLERCAEAMGYSDTKTAMSDLSKVKKFACPDGNGIQRMAYYFADALESRIQGTGWPLYLGFVRQQRASPQEIFKAAWMYMSNSPFAKAFSFFVKETIMGVAKGASILHIMEYQFTGFQYPSLFKALSERPGGPPQVRLIAGNVPHYSLTSSSMEILLEKVEQTGSHLKGCARHFGVPFHFTPWVGKTGEFKMRDHVNPNRGPEEVLAILSVYPLRHINEDLLNPPEKRMQILKAVRSMNPEVFIRGFVTANYSTSEFRRRFRVALQHFEYQYDIVDTFIKRDSPERLIYESEILGRAVLNLIACEQEEIVEKAQTYSQCYATMKRVGLEQMPLSQDLKDRIGKILKSFDEKYMVDSDLNYLLMGWKGHDLHAMAAWKGSRVLDEQQ